MGSQHPELRRSKGRLSRQFPGRASHRSGSFGLFPPQPLCRQRRSGLRSRPRAFLLPHRWLPAPPGRPGPCRRRTDGVPLTPQPGADGCKLRPPDRQPPLQTCISLSPSMSKGAGRGSPASQGASPGQTPPEGRGVGREPSSIQGHHLPPAGKPRFPRTCPPSLTPPPPPPVSLPPAEPTSPRKAAAAAPGRSREEAKFDCGGPRRPRAASRRGAGGRGRPGPRRAAKCTYLSGGRAGTGRGGAVPAAAAGGRAGTLPGARSRCARGRGKWGGLPGALAARRVRTWRVRPRRRQRARAHARAAPVGGERTGAAGALAARLPRAAALMGAEAPRS